MSGMDKNQEWAVKVMLDDITFMLYDLDRGGFIPDDGTLIEVGGFYVSYKRVLIEETEQNGYITTVSDFFICVNHKRATGPVEEGPVYELGDEIVKFDTRGALRKFTLYTLEGFFCGMFIDELEKYRKQMFSINN